MLSPWSDYQTGQVLLLHLIQHLQSDQFMNSLSGMVMDGLCKSDFLSSSDRHWLGLGKWLLNKKRAKLPHCWGTCSLHSCSLNGLILVLSLESALWGSHDGAIEFLLVMAPESLHRFRGRIRADD